MSEIVCCGILIADILARPIKKIPQKGSLVLIDELEIHSGGCAVNTGIALAKLGINTAVIGKIGSDNFGNFLVQELHKYGVDPYGITRDANTSTSATLVLISPDGERSFIHYLGADGEFQEEDINFDIISDCKILHIAGSFLMPKFDGKPTANVLKKAKAIGVITSLDTAWDYTDKWMETIEPCLPYIDIFLPSIEEAKKITQKEEPEEIAEILMSYGIKILGLKMGNKGCYLKTREQEFYLSPYDVKIVDATGAGDCFVAGFLAGVIKEWNIKETGRLANAMGALCATSIGATKGIKNWEDTLRFMKISASKGDGQ